ncbi:hypothetical protein KAMFAM_254 [Bacillus phage Kamfam]|uniref:Uncharacterized protein n=1 Tax=Bacillus phage Vinny TaxID=1805955 RepID=A0A143FJ71_9CAUD|nr:hypothetical protein DNAM5_255 [Bacillus phage Vinny]ASR79397.1 hypothetical protein OTK52_252 [Bacillus phage OTooleKemple52]AXQ67092.1 hypothetical protein KAMFAM_254 [Bacillus phage Kamfam]
MKLWELKHDLKWGRGMLTSSGISLAICSGYMIYTDAPYLLNFAVSFLAGGCFSVAHTLHKDLKRL